MKASPVKGGGSVGVFVGGGVGVSDSGIGVGGTEVKVTRTGSGVVVGGSWVEAGSQPAVTSVSNTAARTIVLTWFFIGMDPPGMV
jgi:hypothetical protein